MTTQVAPAPDPAGNPKAVTALPPCYSMRLTRRQEEIMRLVAAGLGDKEIAAQLGLAPNTVRTHLQRLFREHGLHNRAQAAVRWVGLHEARRLALASQPSAFPRTSAHGRRRWLSPMLASIALLAAGVLAVGAVRQESAPALWAQLNPGPIASAEATGLSRTTAPVNRLSAERGSDSNPASATGVSAPSTASNQVSAARTRRPIMDAQLAPRPSPSAQIQMSLGELGMVNGDRAAAGLPPLRWSDCLATIAAQEAKRVAEQGYLGAPTSQGAECGLLSTAANLAYWPSIDDAKLNAIFMASPMQRSNILGSFQRLGAAWTTAPSGVAYLVVEFG